MSRRSFADILLNSEFNPADEYYSLVHLLYDSDSPDHYSFYSLMNMYFGAMPFADTAISFGILIKDIILCFQLMTIYRLLILIGFSCYANTF